MDAQTEIDHLLVDGGASLKQIPDTIPIRNYSEKILNQARQIQQRESP